MHMYMFKSVVKQASMVCIWGGRSRIQDPGSFQEDTNFTLSSVRDPAYSHYSLHCTSFCLTSFL